VYGDLRVAAGLDPEQYGAAGVPKFPHGAVIHAIQWLPAIAWAARRAGWSPRSRLLLVAAASLASAAILAFALTQTLAGRGRFDLDGWWASSPRSTLLVASGPPRAAPSSME